MTKYVNSDAKLFETYIGSVIIDNAKLTVRAAIVGKVELKNRATLDLAGSINGFLFVDKDCTVDMNGVIIGNVENHGKLNLTGLVVGETSGSGDTKISHITGERE